MKTYVNVKKAGPWVDDTGDKKTDYEFQAVKQFDGRTVATVTVPDTETRLDGREDEGIYLLPNMGAK